MQQERQDTSWERAQPAPAPVTADTQQNLPSPRFYAWRSAFLPEPLFAHAPCKSTMVRPIALTLNASNKMWPDVKAYGGKQTNACTALRGPVSHLLTRAFWFRTKSCKVVRMCAPEPSHQSFIRSWERADERLGHGAQERRKALRAASPGHPAALATRARHSASRPCRPRAVTARQHCNQMPPPWAWDEQADRPFRPTHTG